MSYPLDALKKVWDLQDVISLLNRDNHRSLPKIVGETLQVVILIQRHVSASHQKWNVRVVEPVTVSHYRDNLGGPVLFTIPIIIL